MFARGDDDGGLAAKEEIMRVIRMQRDGRGGAGEANQGENKNQEANRFHIRRRLAVGGSGGVCGRAKERVGREIFSQNRIERFVGLSEGLEVRADALDLGDEDVVIIVHDSGGVFYLTAKQGDLLKENDENCAGDQQRTEGEQVKHRSQGKMGALEFQQRFAFGRFDGFWIWKIHGRAGEGELVGASIRKFIC